MNKVTRPSSPGGGSAGDASRLNRPPTGRNAHDRVLLHTPPVMKKARPTTLAWRNFIGAGFALPRDASRRLALPRRRASRGSAKRGCVRRQGCIFTANAHDRVLLHTPPVMKKARGCAIRVPGTVPLRCAARSGAGLKAPTGRLASVPFPAAPSAWLASLRDCIYTATGTSFRSSLRFGRNTRGIPPSRALSAGRLTHLGARATLSTDC